MKTANPHPTSSSDLVTLLTQAAQSLAALGSESLPTLRELAARAVGADTEALFLCAMDGTLITQGGSDRAELRTAAEDCLGVSTQKVVDEAQALAIPVVADGEVLGAWAAVAWPDAWAAAPSFAPFLALAIRQTHWKLAVGTARAQVGQALREVATVYEIGQAMDKVEIDRLLEMITEKATQVMEAQACSLMLRLETDELVIAASCGLPDEVVENTRLLVGDGIAGLVAATGQPLRLGSLADDPRFQGRPASAPSDVSSSLCMPMKDENGRVTGVLCIRRRVPTPHFTEEDERLFSIFATQAGLAINNARLYATLSHKIQELSTLSALTEAVSSSLDLDQVLNQAADAIVDVVHFDRCRIYLGDVETGHFSAHITRGFRWSAEERPEPDFAPGEGVIGMVAQDQAPLLVGDLDAATPEQRAYARSLDMEAFYAQPIVTRGRCIGVVVVSNNGPHRTMQGGIGLLSTFVNQAAIAIENARFYAVQDRRYSELVTLYDVSKTLAATSGVQKAAQTVNDLATKITDSDAGLLLLLDASQEGMSALHWRGVHEDLARQIRAFLSPVRVPSAARDLCAPRLLTHGDAAGLFGPEWEPVIEDFLTRHQAAAVVPLVADNTAVGFLILGRHGAAFGLEELKLIAAASAQAAAVLSSAATYERRIGQRELELSAVYELMQKVRAATTLEEALNSILDIVASLVWSDAAQLLTLDDDGRTMTVRAARGARAEALVGASTLRLGGDSLAAQALRERGKGRVANNETCSQLALPLVVGDELLGVLTMQSDMPDLYSEESVNMLYLVASQAATIYREMTSLRTLTRYTDNILRSIAAGVITLDKGGVIVTWNRRAEEIARLAAPEIIGQHYTDFVRRLEVDEATQEETMRMIGMTAQTGKIFTRNQLCCNIRGTDAVYVNLSASQLKSEAGEYLGVVVVFEDVTSEVLMKEEVERVSKLAETGQLAANIAHELRNPLSSIKGAAQLLRNELPTDTVSQHGEFLDIIIEEVNGLNRMTTEFLEFSRQTPPEIRRVALNAALTRLLQFMSAGLLNAGVSIIYALGDDVPDVMIDKAQIEQVVKNIIINAAQAMPRGGYITVSTRFFPVTDIVEIAFSDTGVGIPPEKLEKVFTPFFTTKTKGTGLGLAIARKIVETHGGKMTTRSVPGTGATFTIHLPAHPLYPHRLPPARLEIADQRSDAAGTMYSSP